MQMHYPTMAIDTQKVEYILPCFSIISYYKNCSSLNTALNRVLRANSGADKMAGDDLGSAGGESPQGTWLSRDEPGMFAGNTNNKLEIV